LLPRLQSIHPPADWQSIVCPSNSPFDPPVCAQETVTRTAFPPPRYTDNSHLGRETAHRIHNMALADAAKKVAAEYDFTDEQVVKSVKEFLREIDEGLQGDNSSLSQIPTYVTAVPNGTEKVRTPYQATMGGDAYTCRRDCTWQ
jgi:hypothetical protein